MGETHLCPCPSARVAVSVAFPFLRAWDPASASAVLIWSPHPCLSPCADVEVPHSLAGRDDPDNEDPGEWRDDSVGALSLHSLIYVTATTILDRDDLKEQDFVLARRFRGFSPPSPIPPTLSPSHSRGRTTSAQFVWGQWQHLV